MRQENAFFPIISTCVISLILSQTHAQSLSSIEAWILNKTVSTSPDTFRTLSGHKFTTYARIPEHSLIRKNENACDSLCIFYENDGSRSLIRELFLNFRCQIWVRRLNPLKLLSANNLLSIELLIKYKLLFLLRRSYSMSFAKRQKETLETGDIEERYLAARNMILVSAEFMIHDGVSKKQVYGDLIDTYAKKYNLRKRKLGYMIAKPHGDQYPT